MFELDELEFQSHNGAIAAALKFTKPTIYTLFQSHNGAIAALGGIAAIREGHVSIPQWCDCCIFSHISVELDETSFNPTMVRLLHKIPTSRQPPCLRFNPTMVRLLR